MYKYVHSHGATYEILNPKGERICFVETEADAKRVVGLLNSKEDADVLIFPSFTTFGS